MISLHFFHFTQLKIRKITLKIMTSQIIRVFVYGTLKRGQANHYLMTDTINGSAKFIANAQTTEKFPLVVATRYNIPFLLFKPGVGEGF